MKRLSPLVLAASLAAFPVAAGAADGKFDIAVLGGLQALNRNDTGLSANLLSIPAVASLGYLLTPNVALEGDFTWMIPFAQKTDVAPGVQEDRKSPDLLLYQAGVRVALPLPEYKPYVAVGAGAATFLSNTDANRLPQITESQTMFAINFGAGADVPFGAPWGLRVDFREFAAFPSNSTNGLSAGGSADPIWAERATVGVRYRF